MRCVCRDKNFKTILSDIMSSPFLLRLPSNLPLLVSIRSIIYFRFFDLCRFYTFRISVYVDDERKEETRRRVEKIFPTVLDSPLFMIKTHNTVRQALLAITA